MKISVKSLFISALVLLFVAFAPATTMAQNYHTQSKKAVKYYKKAQKQYEKKKYPKNRKYNYHYLLIHYILIGKEKNNNIKKI